MSDEGDARLSELENQIEQFEAKRQAYGPSDVARGGALAILNHEGTVRIERGFTGPEDEKNTPMRGRMATLRHPTRGLERTIKLRGMVKERTEKARRKRRNKSSPTRSFATSPRIAPWGCVSI
ncbi:hypothetical protein [Bradyrhizobium sp. SZCCHNPS2010]|uniref:hypothetical protein n=1 Tax=Bradyrhizobium sp. SZCCHNPS2010 TaxID=3057333 RepID=UPI002916BFDD|nr:hypothetical protein [Bradyrhizobium sp. SZCCHNPS2010]